MVCQAPSSCNGGSRLIAFRWRNRKAKKLAKAQLLARIECLEMGMKIGAGVEMVEYGYVKGVDNNDVVVVDVKNDVKK